MVLVFTYTAGGSVMILGASIAWISIRHPSTDIHGATTAYIALLSSIIGALLGLIAGKSIQGSILSERKEDKKDGDPQV